MGLDKYAFRAISVTLSLVALTTGDGASAQRILADALKEQAATCPNRKQANCASLCFPENLSFRTFESQGLRILIAAGGIADGDGQRLDSFIRGAGHIDEIWLDSPGGNAEEGPEIGRVIRTHRLATRVPAGFQCISSCTLAFLGGAIRHIDIGGAYGVHTFFSQGSYSRVIELLTNKSLPMAERERKVQRYLADRQQQDALLGAKWQVYIQQMGISRNFLTEVVIKQKSLSVMLMTDSDVTEMRQGGMSDIDIAKALQSYTCPQPSVLKSYNVVNTSD